MRFEPGKYYVGDLCYVFNERWNEFCELTIKGNECLDGGFVMEDGTRFWTHGTMYGDGTYRDIEGRKYWVDAGLIGVVSIEQIDDPENTDGGHVIQFDQAFEPYYVNGCFKIGSVIINTAGYEDDEEDNEDEDEDDDE